MTTDPTWTRCPVRKGHFEELVIEKIWVDSWVPNWHYPHDVNVVSLLPINLKSLERLIHSVVL